MGTSPCYKRKNEEVKVSHKISDKKSQTVEIDEQIVEDDDEVSYSQLLNVVYDYIQGELIQEGCNVYSALNTLNGQLLALKMVYCPNIKFKLSNQDDFNNVTPIVDRLMRLEHENIHQIFGWDYSKINNEIIPDEIGILMPYESGGSISWLLQKFSSFSPQLATMFMKQILQGLEYLHSQAIFHRYSIRILRNLKTSNVLVDGEANAKLSDVYILNQYKLSMYSAPECFNSQQYSEYSDVWSAGCIFMEMLTKMHPWHLLSGAITLAEIKSNINSGKLFPYKQYIKNEGILKVFDSIFKINPKSRPTPTQLLTNPIFNNLEAEPLKSVVMSTRRQHHQHGKSYKLQASNISSQSVPFGQLSMSIRRSNNPEQSKYRKMLEQLNSINQDYDENNNASQTQLSHNELCNVVTRKIQIEAKIKEKIHQDNVLVENGIIRPKEGASNILNLPEKPNCKNQLQKPPINQHRSMHSGSLEKIQTVRSSEYCRDNQSIDRLGKLNEMEQLEEMMAQQFYQDQQNKPKINLNDIEQMMMDQFSSSIQTNNPKPQSEQHSEIIITQERPKQQDPDYFEKLMQQQFMEDDEEEGDELQQLEDMISQQYYENQLIKQETPKKPQEEQPETVEDQIMHVSIVAFDKLVQSPKVEEGLLIEDDFIYML